MILSMSQEYIGHKLSDKEAFRLIRSAGFDAVDYSMFYMKYDDNILNSENYLEYVKDLKKYADSINLKINQTHAPFPAYRKGEDDLNKKMPQRIERSIEIASYLGAPHIVVHPIMSCPDGADNFKYNIEFFERLKPIAAKFNVKLAIENTFDYDPKRDRIIPGVCSFPDEIHKYINTLGDENFVVCLDTGHCAVVGTEPEISIREIGKKRLKALHVHDNDYRGDYHRLPYTGKINWDNVTKALSDIDYDGDFTFETDEKVLEGFDVLFYPTVLKFMHDTGRYLIKKIENNKK